MRSLAAVLSILAASSGPAAADHLVTPETSLARLEQRAAQRRADHAAVDRLLASPRSAASARVAGVDLAEARAGLAALEDAELRDLAARAAALDADPAAGLSSDTRDILVVALIVAIVILVLKAV